MTVEDDRQVAIRRTVSIQVARLKPRRVRDVARDLRASSGSDRSGTGVTAPPVAGAIGRAAESRVSRYACVGAAHGEAVPVHVDRGWVERREAVRVYDVDTLGGGTDDVVRRADAIRPVHRYSGGNP